MHISNAQIHEVMALHLQKVHAVRPAAGAQSALPADRLTFSRQATEMHQIRQAMDALPDIRKDVVGGVRQRISAGGYEIDDESLARQLFSCAMDGRFGN